MIIELSVRYTSRCGTTSAILEVDTLDAEGSKLESILTDAANEWFFSTIEEEFRTYYSECGGDLDNERECEEAFERYVAETDVFLDEI